MFASQEVRVHDPHPSPPIGAHEGLRRRCNSECALYPAVLLPFPNPANILLHAAPAWLGCFFPRGEADPFPTTWIIGGYPHYRAPSSTCLGAGSGRHATRRSLGAARACALLSDEVKHSLFGMFPAVPLLGSHHAKRRLLAATRVYALFGVLEVDHLVLGMSSTELSLLVSRYAKRRLLGATRVSTLVVVLEGSTMIDLVSKRCVRPGCTKSPKFGLAGIKKLENCREHAKEGMIDFLNKRCVRPCCTKVRDVWPSGDQGAEELLGTCQRRAELSLLGSRYAMYMSGSDCTPVVLYTSFMR